MRRGEGRRRNKDTGGDRNGRKEIRRGQGEKSAMVVTAREVRMIKEEGAWKYDNSCVLEHQDPYFGITVEWKLKSRHPPPASFKQTDDSNETKRNETPRVHTKIRSLTHNLGGSVVFSFLSLSQLTKGKYRSIYNQTKSSYPPRDHRTCLYSCTHVSPSLCPLPC